MICHFFKFNNLFSPKVNTVIFFLVFFLQTSCVARLQKNFCEGLPTKYPSNLQGTYQFITNDDFSAFGNYKDPSAIIFRISDSNDINVTHSANPPSGLKLEMESSGFYLEHTIGQFFRYAGKKTKIGRSSNLSFSTSKVTNDTPVVSSELGDVFGQAKASICKVGNEYFLSGSEGDSYSLFKLEVNAMGIILTPQSFRIDELDAHGIPWTRFGADIFGEIEDNVSNSSQSTTISIAGEIIVLNTSPEHTPVLSRLARPVGAFIRMYRADAPYLKSVDLVRKRPAMWIPLGSLKNR